MTGTIALCLRTVQDFFTHLNTTTSHHQNHLLFPCISRFPRSAPRQHRFQWTQSLRMAFRYSRESFSLPQELFVAHRHPAPQGTHHTHFHPLLTSSADSRNGSYSNCREMQSRCRTSTLIQLMKRQCCRFQIVPLSFPFHCPYRKTSLPRQMKGRQCDRFCAFPPLRGQIFLSPSS